MSTRKIREALAMVDTDHPSAPKDAAETVKQALAEVEDIEKAAREYFMWNVTPGSRRVLTTIAKESQS